jgi:hypothetical protein
MKGKGRPEPAKETAKLCSTTSLTLSITLGGRSSNLSDAANSPNSRAIVFVTIHLQWLLEFQFFCYVALFKDIFSTFK